MNKLSIRAKVLLKFETPIECIKAVVKNPKILATAGLLMVGNKSVPAQELVGIRDLSITPLVEPVGHSMHTNIFFLQNLDNKTQDFLMQSLEYRYGGQIKGNKIGGTYNVGVEVGSNNFMINNKLVTNKLYEQIHLTVGLSKFFNTPVSINLGYSQKFGNYYLDGMGLAGNVKAGKFGTGGIINLNNKGKITSFEGIQEVKFGKKFTGALRFFNTSDKNMKDAYYNIYGIVDMSSSKFVFVPYVSAASSRENISRGIIDNTFGVFFKPLAGKTKGKAYAYAEVGLNNNGKWSFFTRLNYRLTTPDVHLSPDALLKKVHEKEMKIRERGNKINKSSERKSIFKPRNKLSSRAR